MYMICIWKWGILGNGYMLRYRRIATWSAGVISIPDAGCPDAGHMWASRRISATWLVYFHMYMTRNVLKKKYMISKHDIRPRGTYRYRLSFILLYDLWTHMIVIAHMLHASLYYFHGLHTRYTVRTDPFSWGLRLMPRRSTGWRARPLGASPAVLWKVLQLFRSYYFGYYSYVYIWTQQSQSLVITCILFRGS